MYIRVEKITIHVYYARVIYTRTEQQSGNKFHHHGHNTHVEKTQKTPQEVFWKPKNIL